jgi:GTP cyclohydrolase FolE2
MQYLSNLIAVERLENQPIQMKARLECRVFHVEHAESLHTHDAVASRLWNG